MIANETAIRQKPNDVDVKTVHCMQSFPRLLDIVQSPVKNYLV